MAMTRFGALVADNTRPDGRFAYQPGEDHRKEEPKAYSLRPADDVTIVTSRRSTGQVRSLSPPIARRRGRDRRASSWNTADWLEPVAHPPVLGGGNEVGRLEVVSL